MTTDEHTADLAWQHAILQEVSRTFALTIPQLPPGLRDVVGNAYLLCRIADTIEDEPTLSADEKREFSDRFIRVVAGEEPPAPFAEQLAPRLSDSMLLAERQLVADTPRVLRITHGFSERQRAALVRCVRIMSHGMAEFQQSPGSQGPRRPPPSRPLLLPRRWRRRRDAHRTVLRLFGGNRPAAREVVAARRVVRPRLADDQHSQGHLGRPGARRVLAAARRVPAIRV